MSEMYSPVLMKLLIYTLNFRLNKFPAKNTNAKQTYEKEQQMRPTSINVWKDEVKKKTINRITLTAINLLS